MKQLLQGVRLRLVLSLVCLLAIGIPVSAEPALGAGIKRIVKP
jgi:hypothetical protein